ncbi:MAG: FAD-dependent pyridine nucleotide-disulfide oxidoreductase [Chitinophagaceae bacterium]|nr:FAD-dependent pyridine nucleotide-disulfide oxidoreductase [Chitinophagaceae bacterium]
MKYILKIILGVLLTINLYGQEKCDIKKMSTQDKILLKKFWKDLTDALNTKNKEKLSTLVRFPFNCTRCIIDTSHPTDEPSVRITKKQFDQSQYKIFFENKFIDMANKYTLPKDFFIFTSGYNTLNKKCSYSFNYISVTETKQHPGRQEWFDIQKISGRFKIISTWTLP